MAINNRQHDEQIGNGAAEMVRRGAAAARTTAEAVRQGEKAGAEVVGQASATAEEAQRTTRSLWAGNQDLWRMLPGQGATPGNLPEMSQAFAGLFSDMVRTNLRIGQEVVRFANPLAMIEAQQKLVRGYLDAIVAGQAMLLGVARGTAEDARRQANPPRDPGPQGR
jgi:hypothetical protein